jgi:SM-20-related protein
LAPPPSPLLAGPFTDAELDRLGGGAALVRDGVLSPDQVAAGAAAMAALRDQGALDPAGLGRSRELRPELRGDLTAFCSELALPAPLRTLWQSFEGLRLALNHQAWLGLQRFEVQLACFPGSDAGYVRHLDAFAGPDGRPRPGRRITALLYLNPDWQTDHGGQLRVWEPEGVRELAPLGGRLVLFRSEALPHAVLPTKVHRYAVTAWFRAGEAVPLVPDPQAGGAHAR